MMIAVHAVQTEAGSFRVRLVLARTEAARDPHTADVLEAVTTAVWSLGYPSRRDSHSLEAAQVPRRGVRGVAQEMVRVAIETVALWREVGLPVPDAVTLPYATTV
ncbi:MAG: hypothetical protein HY689_06090 [Chloroflexi bacterium]|nr:hypothetical protein [Chloroflexota bacterium]